ncbi:hypothetical protein GCM10023176_54420 [Micromonospora coerulea]|uniref:Helix-turn-helix resolvase-like protein n=1 Tax=Micromonospora coerulea TaxID=47856 RepID=A0ABP8SZA3_9ACTN
MLTDGSPKIVLQMTDEDVVARVAGVWGTTLRTCPPRSARHKPSYRAAIRGARAADWMERLRPLMGARRREQFDRAQVGWTRPDRRVRLHPAEVAEIVSAMTSGTENARQVAARFGIRRESVYRIMRGRASKPGATPPAVSPDVPRDMAWLAGILEGEGTFSAPSPGSPGRPRVLVRMTDQDIIARVAQMWGSSVYCRRDPRNAAWRPVYATSVVGPSSGRPDVRPAPSPRVTPKVTG